MLRMPPDPISPRRNNRLAASVVPTYEMWLNMHIIGLEILRSLIVLNDIQNRPKESENHCLL